jgi:transposase
MRDVCKKEAPGGSTPWCLGLHRLLGLDGFEVLAAQVVGGEWHLNVETTTTVVACMGCGVRAELHGRRTVRVRDLPSGGRPVVLWWCKRIWRCGEPACEVRTWTERAAAIGPRAVLTERARAEACRRVGKDAHAVAAVARDLGVGWATVMRSVHDHGTPLVDDAARLEGVAALGLDETSFLKATRVAPTRWVTGLVDLERGRLLEVVADRVRRRVQQATLGHRGRKRDPLYRIRKLLTQRGRVRLRAGLAAGDPGGEVAAAWQGKELLRAVYAAAGTAAARAALDRFYRWAGGVQIPELSRLARTVRAWEAVILAFHTTNGCSNGPGQGHHGRGSFGPGDCRSRLGSGVAYQELGDDYFQQRQLVRQFERLGHKITLEPMEAA